MCHGKCKIVIIRESVYVGKGGKRVYRNSLYFLGNISANLKLL